MINLSENQDFFNDSKSIFQNIAALNKEVVGWDEKSLLEMSKNWKVIKFIKLPSYKILLP